MHFVRNWFGVPKGTKVKLVKRSATVSGAPLLVVERLDGGLIRPDEPTYGKWGYVSPEFLSDA